MLEGKGKDKNQAKTFKKIVRAKTKAVLKERLRDQLKREL